MPDGFMVVLVVVATFLLLGVGFAVMVKNFYQKIDQGQALIINKSNGQMTVNMSGGLVLPVVHRAEVMDLSQRTIALEMKNLYCKEGELDVDVTFVIKVNQTSEDILRVARSVGAARASDMSTVRELFAAKLSEAVKIVVADLTLDSMSRDLDGARDRIIQTVGVDLNGYTLDDVSISNVAKAGRPSSDLVRTVDELRDRLAALEQRVSKVEAPS